MRVRGVLLLSLGLLVLSAGGCDDDSEGGGDAGGGDSGGGDTGGGDTGGGDTGGSPPSALVRAAVIQGSCIPDDGVNRYLHRQYTEISDNVVDQRAVQDCLADVTDGCAGTARCGVGFTLGAAEGCPTSCDGDVLTACDDSWHFEIDCTALGKVCDADIGRCVPADRATCTPDETTVSTCSEGTPVSCGEDGRESRGIACAPLGLTCGEIAEGEEGCLGEGASCPADSISTLGVEYFGQGCTDGGTLDACVNGQSHDLSCADVASGLTCQQVAGAEGDVFICGLDDACVPGIENESCEGNSLVICNAGRVERVDCTALGFSGCGPHPELGITAGCTP